MIPFIITLSLFFALFAYIAFAGKTVFSRMYGRVGTIAIVGIGTVVLLTPNGITSLPIEQDSTLILTIGFILWQLLSLGALLIERKSKTFCEAAESQKKNVLGMSIAASAFGLILYIIGLTII